ncbi:hypothetical protein DERP_005814 [Dermatophagoides pteronyssinus]|uniref:G-protein coupled receptors family 1 profile domain-containing protein n=1 Tax=Dermatophagoides pteronyssinus TaxID=6956 RepID=A0ABQ8JA99_DERPT|nr:hypothetical protein DERP_005814 [Dermatophagoides pteronyssinus]
MDTNGEQIIPDIDININEQSIVASSYVNALWTPGFMHQTNETTYVYIDNPHDMIDPFHSNQNFMAIVLTHAITFIVGVIGNSVVIATWARGGKIRSPTATFLVSLACADLLLLIIFMPLETLEYFVITWDYNGHICKLSSFVELLSGMSSILNLVAVSVERFLVIVYPIHARHWCTVTKSRRSLIFVWILAIIFAAPPVFNKSTYSMTYYNNETAITAYYCFEKNDNWAIYFAIYELLTLFVIPALLMMFCYSRVIRELWTSTRVITILTSATNGYHHHHHHPISEATSNHIMPNNKSAISETQSIGGSYHNNNGNSLTNGNTNGPRSYLVRCSSSRAMNPNPIVNNFKNNNTIVLNETELIGNKESNNSMIKIFRYIYNILQRIKIISCDNQTKSLNDVPNDQPNKSIPLSPSQQLHRNTSQFQHLAAPSTIITNHGCNNKEQSDRQESVDRPNQNIGSISRIHEWFGNHRKLNKQPSQIEENTPTYLGHHNQSSSMIGIPAPTPTPIGNTSEYNASTVTDVRNARRQLYCQVIKMLLFIVILFHVCWGPRLIFNVIKSTGIGQFDKFAYSARVYFYLLSFIHSALNPFVYGFMSSNFRRMMMNSCSHRRHLKQRTGTLTPVNNSLAEAMATTSCLPMARTGTTTGYKTTQQAQSFSTENSHYNYNYYPNQPLSSSIKQNSYSEISDSYAEAELSQTPSTVCSHRISTSVEFRNSCHHNCHHYQENNNINNEDPDYSEVEMEINQMIDQKKQQQQQQNSSNLIVSNLKYPNRLKRMLFSIKSSSTSSSSSNGISIVGGSCGARRTTITTTSTIPEQNSQNSNNEQLKTANIEHRSLPSLFLKRQKHHHHHHHQYHSKRLHQVNQESNLIKSKQINKNDKKILANSCHSLCSHNSSNIAATKYDPKQQRRQRQQRKGLKKSSPYYYEHSF